MRFPCLSFAPSDFFVVYPKMGRSQYSEKYIDDPFEYRHVVLPTEMAKLIPKNRLLSEDMDSGEIVVSSIRTGMKREFAMMMKAQSELGGLPVGRRRVTRSQNAGSAIKGDVGSGGKTSKKVKGSHSKIMKKDVEEKMTGKDEGKVGVIEVLDSNEGVNCSLQEVGIIGVLDSNEGVKSSLQEVGIIGVLDSNEGVKSSLQEVGTNIGNDLRSLEDNLAVDRKEAEKMGADLKKDDLQPLCTESLVPQGESSDGDVIHEDNRIVGGASDSGCERFGKKTSWLSETPLRRFTRSALKLQDKAMGLKSGVGLAETGGAATSNSSPSKLEMKMSKKVELKRVPMKLKDLLETGLLEDLPVRYIHGSKVLGRLQTELCGVIRGSGILCSCNECKGEKVVTPNQFELHAHSGNKRPPEYIYLENGKNLRDVLNACKDDLSDSLERVIKNAIGRSDTRLTAFCLNCKELVHGASADSSMLCDSCAGPKESTPSPIQISGIAHRSPLVDSSTSVTSSCHHEVPDSVKVSSSGQPKMKPQGKLTRKDLRMHKLVLAENVLPEGTALSYVMHGKKRLEGYKKDGAIFCSCCNNVVSPSQFEAHAGFASHRKPYHNIFTSNGVSLHQLSLELSKNRKSSTEDNDDLCSICEDGGNLLCCENCPRAFHSECVGLSRIPQGKWYCKYCQNMFEKEKFSERSANAIAAGRVAGTDPLEEINQRCIRIVGTFEADIGGCAICRGHGFSKSEFNATTVIICDQCEKEYHVGCLREQKIDDLKALPANEWFCSRQCQNVNTTLKKLIGNGEQMLPESIADIVKKKFEEQGSQHNPKLDIRWRLLSGKTASEDTRVWLSGAVSIFHDRFDPIADSSTGRLDLIPHMVYGRQFKNQDFCGMYCAILTVNSVVVSAGIVRIFGEEVAELPLVATRSDCQGKGYFQSLFFCIENLLASLNVKDLVLPAADEAESLWKNRFGFEKLGQEQLDQYKKSYQMMIFQGTSVLHKSISNS